MNTNSKPLKPHALSELFPVMDGPTYAQFAADVKANGLREPILLYGGLILDGRNRYRACLDAGIEPATREFTGTDEQARAYVVSTNLHRRHLSESQRAMVAARLATLGKGKSKCSNLSIKQSEAAKSMGVSRTSVQTARKLLAKAPPTVVKAVESGALSVNGAARSVFGAKSCFARAEQASDWAQYVGDLESHAWAQLKAQGDATGSARKALDVVRDYLTGKPFASA